jgi:hypothetical protein
MLSKTYCDLDLGEDSLDQYAFLQYVSLRAGKHAATFEDSMGQSTFPLLSSVITRRNVEFFGFFDSYRDETQIYVGDEATPLSVAAYHGMALFCKDAIIAGAEANWSYDKALLAEMAGAGHLGLTKAEEVIRLLLENGATVEDIHII